MIAKCHCVLICRKRSETVDKNIKRPAEENQYSDTPQVNETILVENDVYNIYATANSTSTMKMSADETILVDNDLYNIHEDIPRQFDIYAVAIKYKCGDETNIVENDLYQTFQE